MSLIHSSSSFLGIDTKGISHQFTYIEKLNLTSKTKKILAKLAIISADRLSRLRFTSHSRVDRSICSIEQTKRMEQLAKKLLAEPPVRQQQKPAFDINIFKEIDDFRREISLLLNYIGSEETERLKKEIEYKTLEIEYFYYQNIIKKTHIADDEIRNPEVVYKEIGELLEDYSKKIEKSESFENLDYGAQILVGHFKAFQKAQLANVADKTSACFNHLKGALEKVNNETGVLGEIFLNKEQRIKLFKNVKLMERINEIEHLKEKRRLAKQAKKLQKKFDSSKPSKQRKIEKKLNKLQKQIEISKHRYTTLRASIEEYYSKFAFTDDEITDVQFKAYAMETHRPTWRGVLKHANDLFNGAINAAHSLRFAELKELIKPGSNSYVDSKILKIYEEIGKKENWNELSISMLDELEKSLNLDTEATHKLKKIFEFIDKVEIFKKEAPLHKDLGKDNMDEMLPLEADEWKEKQERVAVAIQGYFDKMCEAYLLIEAASEQEVGVNLKKAGKVLVQARDNLLSSRVRWSKPIERTIRTSDERNKISVNHKMVCQNEGYSSSEFRGRKLGEDPILPNYWDVTMEVNGKRTCEYSRSAINIEFFLHDKKERKEVSRSQVGELLSNKVLKAYEKASKKDNFKTSTLNKPFIFETSENSLLSTDSLREWLMRSQKVKSLIEKTSVKHFDVSQWERRILSENLEAWESFDRDNMDPEIWKDVVPYTFTDSQGNLRTMEAIVNDKKEVVFKITEGSREVYAQLDIAYYNSSCNKFSKLMTVLETDKKVLKKIEKLQSLAQKIAKNRFGRFVLKYFCNCSNVEIDLIRRGEAKPKDLFVSVVKIVKFLLKIRVLRWFVNKNLRKKQINISTNELKELAKQIPNYSEITVQMPKEISDAEELMRLAIPSLEALKGHKVGKKILSQYLINQMKIEGATEEEIDKIELPKLTAEEPKESVIKGEGAGLHRILELGVPFIKVILESELGKKVVLKALQKKNKEITVADLEAITEVPEFSSKVQNLGAGNTIQDDINFRALAKHDKRVDSRLKTIVTEMQEIEKVLVENKLFISKKKRIETLNKELEKCRDALEFAEENYAKQTANSKKIRKKAFDAWQWKRNELSTLLNSEIKKVGQDPEIKKWMELERYKHDVQDAFNEVYDLLTYKEYRSMEMMNQSMYYLSSAVTVLGCILKEDPHTGCRSGKDRTSLQCIEVGLRFHLREHRGRLLDYREIENDPLTSEIREQYFLNAGHIDELAEKNIGSPGLNLFGSYSGLGKGKELWDLSIGGGLSKVFSRQYKYLGLTSSTFKLERSFNDSVNKIGELHQSIHKQKVTHKKTVIALYHQLFTDCHKETDLEIIKTHLKEIRKLSLQLREKTEKANEEYYKELEKQWLALATTKNALAETDGCEHLNQKCEDKINELRQQQKSLALSTNSENIVDYRVSLFQSVIERKLDLEKERCELKLKTDLTKKEEKRLKEIDKFLSSHQLTQPPDQDSIDYLCEILIKELNQPPKNLSVMEAKQSYIADETLAWGKDMINSVLTLPSNWLTKREIGIRFSSAGTAYVQVTKVEPQNIDEEGGVPAGLRDVKGYNKRPANLNKTVSYILGDEGKPIKEYVSFRIAQFPTMEAAKEALITMMRENPTKIVDYHDNTLLTPLMFPFKPDRKLLRQHERNVRLALDSIMQDIEDKGAQYKDAKGKVYSSQDVQKIKKKFALSNFGVNEGAVGKLMGLKLGWHTSMGEFNNSSSQKLNKKIEAALNQIQKNPFEELTAQERELFDRLGAIVQIGQEFEAIWAKNDYLDADVGNNQVKSPALWRALDSLLGVVCNTHCMSAKDRASVVESNAIEHLMEVEMNLLDHKRRCAKVIGKRLSEEEKGKLLQGCFAVDEIKEVLEQHEKLALPLDDLIKSLKKTKIEQAKKALGLGSQRGFIQQKTGIRRFNALKPGGVLISENIPLMKESDSRDAATHFPQLALKSIYRDTVTINPLHTSSEEVEILKYRHRMQQNRRDGLKMADLVTKENTGVPGDKLVGGSPLKRFYSGFDPDYVLYRFHQAKNDNEFISLFYSLLGMSQIDIDTRCELADRAFRIKISNATVEEKIKLWSTILKQVEDIKFQSHRPLTKVKS